MLDSQKYLSPEERISELLDAGKWGTGLWLNEIIISRSLA